LSPNRLNGQVSRQFRWSNVRPLTGCSQLGSEASALSMYAAVGRACRSRRSVTTKRLERSRPVHHAPSRTGWQCGSCGAPKVAPHRDDLWIGDPAALVEIAPAALVGQGEHESARLRV